MIRTPTIISEETLLAFTTIVALATVVVAFVAYVGAWIAGRREQRRLSAVAEAAQPAPELGQLESAARNGMEIVKG